MHPLLATFATAALVYRAYSRQSLTPIGIFTAFLTAVAHAIHPWSVFYGLLATFFLAGTAVTKIKHEKKTNMTVSSSGGNNPMIPHPRTAVQVLANSGMASLLIMFHAWYLVDIKEYSDSNTCLKAPPPPGKRICPMDLLPFGIFANYAAVAADTFASELGILSEGSPILITDVLSLLRFSPRRVPRGTNGGVTILGSMAGMGGAGLIAIVSVLFTPFCAEWRVMGKLYLVLGLTIWGTLGMLLDSMLGGLLQASVVDVRTGRVIEGDGGIKVQYIKAGEDGGQRKLVTGWDMLDNNGVNFVMASTMSIGAIIVSWRLME